MTRHGLRKQQKLMSTTTDVTKQEDSERLIQLKLLWKILMTWWSWDHVVSVKHHDLMLNEAMLHQIWIVEKSKPLINLILIWGLIDNVIMVSWGGFDETLYLNVDKGYGNQTLVLETLRNTRKN